VSEPEPGAGAPHHLRPRRPEDFDSYYARTPAWDIGRPQPAFVELARTEHNRLRFVESLRLVVPAGGAYHLLCFSDRQPGALGPRRVTQAEIRDSFSDGWQVDSIEATTIDVLTNPRGVHAWRASLTRI
jgi:hypothetical protein